MCFHHRSGYRSTFKIKYVTRYRFDTPRIHVNVMKSCIFHCTHSRPRTCTRRINWSPIVFTVLSHLFAMGQACQSCQHLHRASLLVLCSGEWQHSCWKTGQLVNILSTVDWYWIDLEWSWHVLICLHMSSQFFTCLVVLGYGSTFCTIPWIQSYILHLCHWSLVLRPKYNQSGSHLHERSCSSSSNTWLVWGPGGLGFSILFMILGSLWFTTKKWSEISHGNLSHRAPRYHELSAGCMQDAAPGTWGSQAPPNSPSVSWDVRSRQNSNAQGAQSFGFFKSHHRVSRVCNLSKMPWLADIMWKQKTRLASRPSFHMCSGQTQITQNIIQGRSISFPLIYDSSNKLAKKKNIYIYIIKQIKLSLSGLPRFLGLDLFKKWFWWRINAMSISYLLNGTSPTCLIRNWRTMLQRCPEGQQHQDHDGGHQ